MAGNEQEQDRSEPATPFKLREARQRGQVAKSMELAAWLTLLVATSLAWTMTDDLVKGQLNLSRALFSQSGGITLTTTSALNMFSGALSYLISVFGFFVTALVVAAVLANVVQVGPVFSWHPLKPDFTRVNPVTGFKRVFNIRMVYEAFKTILKLLLLTATVYVYMQRATPNLMSLLMMDVRAYPATLLREVLWLAATLLAVMGLLAAADFAFVKWDYAKRMRMSHREVREEVKRRDGDPKVKAKIRELQREAARRAASLKRVPDADVLITNPTHLSVALQYKRGKTLAPIVIAKASGEMAIRMRRKAARHRVPTVENRTVARALFRGVSIDRPILPETYPAVAKILMWAYAQRKRAL